MRDSIFIKGARENNLKNIDREIPWEKLVGFTGLSGSGKSSLAFETIYAEGQRRYVESLSSYARMFLGQMDKPDVDYIEGLSPAISIDQKTTSRNPRSTVGTVTEIYEMCIRDRYREGQQAPEAAGHGVCLLLTVEAGHLLVALLLVALVLSLQLLATGGQSGHAPVSYTNLPRSFLLYQMWSIFTTIVLGALQIIWT